MVQAGPAITTSEPQITRYKLHGNDVVGLAKCFAVAAAVGIKLQYKCECTKSSQSTWRCLVVTPAEVGNPVRTATRFSC